MIHYLTLYHRLTKQKDGLEREEIDEVALIEICGPIRAETTEFFYQV